MAEKEKVTISVHQQSSGPGHVVQVRVGEGKQQRVAVYPVPAEDGIHEAKALAESIKNGIDAGIPVAAFFGE